VKERKLRVIVLLEANDAAGKGGTIKAITENAIRLQTARGVGVRRTSSDRRIL
jgi:polyphosphate kinase 2 (PPK2 family)